MAITLYATALTGFLYGYFKPSIDLTTEGDFLLWYNGKDGRTYIKLF